MDHTALVKELPLARLATQSSHWLLLGVKTSSDPPFWIILGTFNWFTWWSLDIYVTQSENTEAYFTFSFNTAGATACGKDVNRSKKRFESVSCGCKRDRS